jgi:hypothetical protein
MGRFKPYRPKHRPLLTVSHYLLSIVALLMMVSAFAPYPYGMTVRFGRHVPPSGVVVYRWVFALDAVFIWLIVFWSAYRRRSSK